MKKQTKHQQLSNNEVSDLEECEHIIFFNYMFTNNGNICDLHMRMREKPKPLSRSAIT